MSLTNINREARRPRRPVARDLRFAGTVAAGLVAGVLGVGAISAPLLGWDDWPARLQAGKDDTVQMQAPIDRAAPARRAPGNGGGSASAPALVAVPGAAVGGGGGGGGGTTFVVSTRDGGGDGVAGPAGGASGGIGRESVRVGEGSRGARSGSVTCRKARQRRPCGGERRGPVRGLDGGVSAA